METTKPLRLVKDFINFRVTFFWIDFQNQQVSPELGSLELASEWFIQYHYSSFSGKERRTSQIDRRRSRQSTQQQYNGNGFSKRSADRTGRRITDQPIYVSIDRATDKINEFKNSFKQGDKLLNNSQTAVA